MATTKTPETKPVMETVFIPKIPGEDETVFVGINGKSWLIPRGKSCEVPVFVADMLRERQRRQEAADEFSAAEKEKAKIIHGV